MKAKQHHVRKQTVHIPLSTHWLYPLDTYLFCQSQRRETNVGNICVDLHLYDNNSSIATIWALQPGNSCLFNARLSSTTSPASWSRMLPVVCRSSSVLFQRFEAFCRSEEVRIKPLFLFSPRLHCQRPWIQRTLWSRCVCQTFFSTYPPHSQE